MIELLSCPFCGSTYTQTRYMGLSSDRGFEQGWRGECCGCGALTRAYSTESEAIEAWNTRAVESASGLVYIPSFRDNGKFPERIWASLNGEVVAYARERTCRLKSTTVGWACSECHVVSWQMERRPKPSYCPNCGARVEVE